jgi:hypothetical protein
MLSMHRIVLAAMLVVGVLSTYPQGQTRAYLTSAVNGAGNTFTAGYIQIGAGIAVGDTLTMSNMVPGDSFLARLTIQNSGNLDLHYAMTTSTSGDATLASTLQLTIRAKTSNPCSNQDGAIVYGPGNLSAGAIGNPAHGADPGDRVVTAGSSDNLCFKVALPGTAPLSVQGKNIGATFSFAAEQ